MNITLQGTLRDGSAPDLLPAIPQRVWWPRAEDGQIDFTLRRQDGTAVNLTSSSLTLAVREYRNSGPAVISRQATITNALLGQARFTLTAADTFETMLERKNYRYDIAFVDAAGKRWQVVPESEWFCAPIVAYPSDTPTAPTPVSPLALGTPYLEAGDNDEWVTDASGTELVGPMETVNFDEIPAAVFANLVARLMGVARVSGGTGTVRVRAGGTFDGADGTVLVTSDPITGTTYAAFEKVATVAKPAGLQFVKITLQAAAGQTLTLLAGNALMRGAL